MQVTYIDHMGTDLSVVNAARVSFSKKSEWECSPSDSDPKCLSAKDAKLIKFLAENNHWTPFGHTAVTIHVKAPIFVARQLGKHQVGLVWNEVSRRYVADEPEFFEPSMWRKAAENVKQGSSDEPWDDQWTGSDMPYLWGVGGRYDQFALRRYNDLIACGVCPEQARMVLPQSMMTEWYWTGSVAAFSRVCTLRLDSHSQRETQEVAQQISDIVGPLFPVSWEALQC